MESTAPAVVYLGGLATLVAYAAWGHLLQRYPTGAVAPFALLAPCVGIAASALVLGEGFTPVRLAGMALILAGLAVAVFPDSRARAGVLARVESSTMR